MQGEKLEGASTALLIFDMLNGHIKTDDPATRARYRPVIANNVRLLASPGVRIVIPRVRRWSSVARGKPRSSTNWRPGPRTM